MHGWIRGYSLSGVGLSPVVAEAGPQSSRGTMAALPIGKSDKTEYPADGARLEENWRAQASAFPPCAGLRNSRECEVSADRARGYVPEIEGRREPC